MRVRGITAIVTTVLIVGLLGGCGSDPDIRRDGTATADPSKPAGVDLSKVAFVDLSKDQTPEVDALDNVFKAKFVTVKAGSTITFRNNGRNIHDIIPSVDLAFKPVEAGAFDAGTAAKITFDKPGDYPYYCSLHGTTTKGMIGAVRVLKG